MKRLAIDQPGYGAYRVYELPKWQRQARPFSGLVFGHQIGGTIGQYVKDLELIAQAG